jgi:hypothetical protein
MMNFTELASVTSVRPVPFTDQLRLAVAAYLARFKGSSREHTESGLRCFLAPGSDLERRSALPMSGKVDRPAHDSRV